MEEKLQKEAIDMINEEMIKISDPPQNARVFLIEPAKSSGLWMCIYLNLT